MKRRTPRGRPESSPTPARPHSARRQPQWNTYLTDDSRYKLSQQQQLQRAVQQLSAAHFSSRSPAASASRRRLAAASAHSSAWSTPQDAKKSRARLADVQDTGELKTARRLQFADVSMDLEEPTPRRRATAASAVSFQMEDEVGVDPQHKANLQGELEVLEQMLRELETETERLSWQQTPQKRNMQQRSNSPRVRRTGSATKLKETRGLEDEDDKDEDYGEDNGQDLEEREGEGGEEGDEAGVGAEERLGDVCYKSLQIGLDLTSKLDTLKKELDNERRLREDRDLKVEMLEQEVRSTQAKCNYLEAKYLTVASQVDGMREAVIATEEAIHRMTLAFECSQRRRGKTSNPTTPSKPGASRTPHPKDTHTGPKKAATPKNKRIPTENRENWNPNDQQ
ncbi:hypothetical protein PF005_g26078 [Phytophthora fragariae]|uniref:Uncharacterized protein n=1 Tax=Phytophthora fragariae TaxID=53985 RepID=A0A6A3VX10_9STRA|nr:hypothetical protein PF003_g10449 [Phytophthora fragariae]KAE8934978.1 hypothetical protein PF009_g15066 [Phytophthora fragariae]KAE9002284.1 hypothetical protein PF011_g13384 [Phytophthora fragariae]KAE9072281.1 hypothetical protein PF010_g25548 [Phytophthora fragariae]KAE9089236.1 hypothetical protein PF006_g25406 [Phytophthora fragariae]